MNTLDAMKQALDDMGESFLTVYPATKQAMREAIAHEEAMAAKPVTERNELIRNLREHNDERLYEEADLLMHEAADMLEQDGIDLDDLPDELTVAYMQGHSKGVEAGKKQAQQVEAPQGYIHVDDIKQLCRDFSSRNNNVYIKDVEACLDAMAAPQPPQGEAG